jgi:hypothetical protein
MATKGRFIVRAEGHPDLAYDNWGQAQLRVTEYKANRVEAQLIDLPQRSLENRPFVVTAKPANG